MPRPTTNRNRPCATLRGRVIFTSAPGDASGLIYAPGFFPFRSDNLLTIFMVIGGKNGTNEARLHQNNGRCRCNVRTLGASRSNDPQSGRTIPLPTPRAKALMEMFGLNYPILKRRMARKPARNSPSLFRTPARWARSQLSTVRRWRVKPSRRYVSDEGTLRRQFHSRL